MRKLVLQGRQCWPPGGNNEQWFRQVVLALITSVALSNILMGNISLYLLQTGWDNNNVELITININHNLHMELELELSKFLVCIQRPDKLEPGQIYRFSWLRYLMFGEWERGVGSGVQCEGKWGWLCCHVKVGWSAGTTLGVNTAGQG